MKVFVRAVSILAITGLVGCDFVSNLVGGGDSPALVKEAHALLADGQFPASLVAYNTLADEHSDSVHVAMGQAYVLMLAGDFAGADNVLKAVRENAGDQLPILNMRRAIVALHAGNLDRVKKYGEMSEMPAGLLLAAECHILEGDDEDRAEELLERAQDGDDTVATVASEYLDLLENDHYALAEATATWSVLGRLPDSMDEDGLVGQSLADVADALSDRDDTPELQAARLVWAGRAAVSGELDVSEFLIEQISGLSKEHRWRTTATTAIAMAAAGRDAEAMMYFDVLTDSDNAPAQGVADARATAASVATSKKAAKQLAAGINTNAAARGLYEAGARPWAKKVAPEGDYKSFLEAK